MNRLPNRQFPLRDAFGIRSGFYKRLAAYLGILRVRQLNCVKLHCQDLLGDNPERLFLGGAKIHPQIQITGHLTENLHIFLK